MPTTKIEFRKLESIKRKANEMPVKEKKEKDILTKKEAIIFLKDEIKSLMKKNYTLEEIANFLKDGGLDVSASTLKYYSSSKKPKAANKIKPKTLSEQSHEDKK